MRMQLQAIWKLSRFESRVEDTLSLNPIGLPICSPARPGLESSPHMIRLGAPHGCCCAETKTQTQEAAGICWPMSRRSSARSTSCSGRSIADRPTFVSDIGDSYMTETLAEKTCTPCRGGVPPLARDEALRFQAQAPDWELRDEARRRKRAGEYYP